MTKIIDTLKEFFSANWWIALAALFACLVLLVLFIVVTAVKSSKHRKDIKAIEMLEKEAIEHHEKISHLSEQTDSLSKNVNMLHAELGATKEAKAKLERELSEKQTSLVTLQKDFDEEKVKAEVLEEELKTANNERSVLKENYGVLLRAIELKKDSEPTCDSPETNIPKELSDLRAKPRKELFKLAHEVGLGNFAQWSNLKLAEEIFNMTHKE